MSQPTQPEAWTGARDPETRTGDPPTRALEEPPARPRHLHVDPWCGAAGDMLLGALLDVGLEEEALRRGLGRCPLGEWQLHTTRVRRGALEAVHVQVIAPPPPPGGRHLRQILALLADTTLPSPVVERASAVFRTLGEAEARVHGIPVEEVHFHEAGAVDAIIDVLGVSLGLHHLGVTTVTCGPWRLGQGSTTSDHGLIPVPAPATLALARGFELEQTGLPHELFTPTAAALMATLATPLQRPPAMRCLAVGQGAGTRDLVERPNICRVLLGELALPLEAGPEAHPGDGDSCVLLETNLDDQSPEEVAYALECAREAGALDAWATAAVFKKGRMGVVLSVLVRSESQRQVERALLQETTTLGLRVREVQRRVLQRDLLTVSTPFGSLRVKVARDRDGRLLNVAPEYEDARHAARRAGVPLRQVMSAARQAAAQDLGSGE
jgi:uncharacterized protein (TIGR00299 family) protein